MGKWIISYTVLFILLICNDCCAQQSYMSAQNTSQDTVYVKKTETDTTETYKLIHCFGGKSKVLFTLTSEDGSSIDYLFSYNDEGKAYDCFAKYNNAADGNSFLFFNRIDKSLYITYGCYAGFYPIPESIDFDKRTALLENKWSGAHNPTDTLYVGRDMRLIGYKERIKIIEVEFKEILSDPQIQSSTDMSTAKNIRTLISKIHISPLPLGIETLSDTLNFDFDYETANHSHWKIEIDSTNKYQLNNLFRINISDKSNNKIVNIEFFNQTLLDSHGDMIFANAFLHYQVMRYFFTIQKDTTQK